MVWAGFTPLAKGGWSWCRWYGFPSFPLLWQRATAGVACATLVAAKTT